MAADPRASSLPQARFSHHSQPSGNHPGGLKSPGGRSGDTILVVDAANGALAGLAAPILGRFGFRAIEEVGAADDGSVNVNCGAGLLEGHGRIGPDFISDAGGDFRTVELAVAGGALDSDWDSQS